MSFLIPVLLLGLWEVGRMVEIQQVVSNAAREGGRLASTAQYSDTQIITMVRQYLQDAGVPAATAQNAAVTVKNNGFTGNPTPLDNNPQNATELDQLIVTVSVPLQDLRWVSLYVVTNPNTTVTGQAAWSSLKDQSYPDPTPLPGY